MGRWVGEEVAASLKRSLTMMVRYGEGREVGPFLANLLLVWVEKESRGRDEGNWQGSVRCE